MKILWKRFHFDSAHFLPDYEGRCHNLHGHRWFVDIGVEGGIDTGGSYKGMILDFSDLRKLVDPIFNRLDHNCLNEILDNPTAENIVDYLVEEAKKVLDEYSEHKYLRLVVLRVWETPDACVEWREG